MGLLYILCAIAGIYLMISMGRIEGLMLGGILLYLLMTVHGMGKRLTQLEDALKSSDKAKEPCPDDEADAAAFVHGVQTESGSGQPRGMNPEEDDEIPVDVPPLPVDEPDIIPEIPLTVSEGPQGSHTHGYDAVESRLDGVVERLRVFFTTGNVVVKAALVVLFFGVGFLLKFASERNMLPVELRYIAVAVSASGFLVLGWKLRNQHRQYALLLQGGAIGILYMTIFAAAKIHHLLPLELTFPVLVGLAAFSGVLAVLQDARMTAVFGAAGGFLAPILTSTGTGSHVMLFSYYAVLNTGILGIAWFKSWRELNLVGFIFTFGIGTFWGGMSYKSELFRSTEPFLVLFFLYFSAISVLFASRQEPRLKGYVDGSLVFGLPIVAFALQSQLVEGIEYGLAVSAVLMSFYYLVLASMIWRRGVETMRTLTESFLALGIVFGSLAIPLALDGKWTASSWAMEGAALIWIGIRQHRLKARVFGLLLQVGGSISFILTVRETTGAYPVLNGFFIGGMVIGSAALFSAYCLQKHADTLKFWERNIHLPVMIWGLLWWYGTGLLELDRHSHGGWKYSLAVGLFGANAILGSLVHSRLNWPSLKYPLFTLIGFLWGLLLLESVTLKHPFQDGGFISWSLSIGVFYRVLNRYERSLTDFWTFLQHQAGLLLLVFLACLESAWGMNKISGGSETWVMMVWGLVPVTTILFMIGKGEKISWPVFRYVEMYTSTILYPVVLFIVFWIFAGGLFYSGDPSPLPFIPILNPLEVVQSLGIMVLYLWIRKADSHGAGFTRSVGFNNAVIALGILGFFWVNTVIGRTIHMFGDIPYSWDRIWHSVIFQAAISVFWTLLSLVTMTGAARRLNRGVWFAGSFLLGIVVVKLFIIDLSGSGTVARIVSFILTGLLMLIIGFISPLPPRPKETGQ